MNPAPQLPPDIDYRPPQPQQGMSSGAKWGIGCGIGCLTLLLIFGGIALFTYFKVKELAVAVVDQYTSETPIVFEAPEAEQATIDALVARFDAFRTAMEEGTDTEALRLTGEEINLLIHHHPDWEQMAGHTAVEIEGNQLSAHISLPLDEVLPMLKGRYLNGKATIRLELSESGVEAYIDGIEVANQTAPPEIIAELQKENLLREAQHDPEFRKLTETLESIRIEDGQLIIVPKPATERKTEPAPPAEPPTPAVEA